MTEERTQSDKMMGISITVNLGGTDYNIKPLPIGKNREWLKKWRSMIEEHQRVLNTPSDAIGFIDQLNDYYAGDYDFSIELLQDYAPDLPWNEIEEHANVFEIQSALGEVLKLANPTIALDAACRIASAVAMNGNASVSS